MNSRRLPGYKAEKNLCTSYRHKCRKDINKCYCECCGDYLTEDNGITIHHVIPLRHLLTIRKITGNGYTVSPYRRFAILCRKCHDKVEKIYQQEDKDLELLGMYMQDIQQCDESLFIIYSFVIQYYYTIYDDFIKKHKNIK
jgi:hypothetical protein